MSKCHGARSFMSFKAPICIAEAIYAKRSNKRTTERTHTRCLSKCSQYFLIHKE
ncbi:hypothetical protein Gotri_012865 [Gossypium trilobum]|uniref:Uncharacterized protein n=1 Tax=Gossypium trilobum TaxID=34281 RepID=A0A7J9DRN8_9ROSI|nr:hypothetical protein [Gossypium trilobum]